MNIKLNKKILDCMKNIPADGGGGCTPQKALKMAEYIVKEEIVYIVEIGVYRGKSFFPQALATKSINGKIIGIDPYLKEAAREKDLSKHMSNIVNKLIDNWDTLDTYVTNLNKIIELELGNNAFIFREKSEAAAKYLPNDIGLLHIDGNHDVEFVTKDINYFLPKIKQGGIIVMDDTNWSSVQKCLHLLTENGCTLEGDYKIWQVWRKGIE